MHNATQRSTNALVFLASVVLALVWIGVSLYAIFKNPKSMQEPDGSRQ